MGIPIATYEADLEAAHAAFQELTETDEPMGADTFAQAERRLHNARRALTAVLDAKQHGNAGSPTLRGE